MKKLFLLFMILSMGVLAGEVEVVGRGVVKLTPDIVHMTIGTVTNNDEVEVAIEENGKIVENITDELLKLGIARRDLYTSSYNVYFRNSGSYGKKEKASYEVANNIRVTIRDIKLLSTVINQAIDSGANNIWGITFDSSQREGNEALAREKAVADAKSKAKEYATYVNKNLGEIEYLTEVIYGDSPLPIARQADYLGSVGINAPSSLDLVREVKVIYELD